MSSIAVLFFSYAICDYESQRCTHTNIFSAIYYNSPQYLLSRSMVSFIIRILDVAIGGAIAVAMVCLWSALSLRE